MAETGGGPADAYIGSLISLTSKSEIRYEGLLYTVDTEKSHIALQNVRSFGTEGRKKDGPQIPASDKVYDYIIFRGTDIKDLLVKLSPPQIHNDPAIISLQAQSSQPVSAPPAYVPPVAGISGDTTSSSSYVGLSSFQSGLPLYRTANSGVPLWAPPPLPLGPNGTGLAMPMFWQGFYKPSEEQQPLEHRQFTPQPPPQLHTLPTSQTLPSQAQSSVDLPVAPIFSQPTPVHTSPIQQLDHSEGSSTVSIVTPPRAIHAASPILTGLEKLGLDPVSVSSPSSSLISDFPSSVHGISKIGSHPVTFLQKQSEENEPHLEDHNVESSEVSGGISHSGSTIQGSASHTVQRMQKFVSASGKCSIAYKQVSKQVHKTTEPSKSGYRQVVSRLQQASTQPLLPLPVSSTEHKPLIQGNDGLLKQNPIRRGRGRGNGMGRAGRGAHTISKFLEDFDFIAMNEKFKKEEVWDELLKEESKDNADAEGLADEGMESNDLDRPFDKSLSDIARRSVYVKDDFFDSLSCDTLNREGRSERTKFSEQRKIDTETFGSFPLRHRGSYRGRHGARGRRVHGRSMGRGQGTGYGRHGHGEGRTGPPVAH